MNNLDLTQIELQHLITHHIGNKSRDENYELSVEESIIENETKELLLKYFLSSVKTDEYFSFFHPIEVEMNDIFSIVVEMLSDTGSFINLSQNMAKLLYEQSVHPNIKEGELNIAFFTDVVIDDKNVEAIGIFKSEKEVPFIKMSNQKSNFNIRHNYGFEIKGIDKACIILNIEKETGYRMLIVDNTNKAAEAQYWMDDFLKVKPISNEYHQTNQFLNMTKQFITKQLPNEFEVSKTDQIDMLNRSVGYFKKNSSFTKNEFEEEVLFDSHIVESFRRFDNNYRKENDIEPADVFEISPQAVKKQARVFKSVLKLDKNFHIYIHGNRELIEQGVDERGRKYYKIFYNEES
jgi:hypothetical protein